jgi:hypothetical protein
MKLAPKSWKRPVILLLVGLLVILAWLKLTWWRFPHHIYDEAGLLTRDEWFLSNANLAELTSTTGVDLRIVIGKDFGAGSLEAYALERMRKLGVGSTTERRGVLVVLDLEVQRARVEVGPKLEGVVTDAYSGYLARDVIVPMMVAKVRPIRLLASLFYALKFRIDEAALGREWDPAELSAIQERQRLAVGGGADALGTPADLSRMANQPAPPQFAARYAAQPTASEALSRYLEWVQEPFAYHDVGLMSEGAKEILREISWDVPAGLWRFDQVALQRERFVLVDRGARAVAIPTGSPLTHPIWFARGRTGWQFELIPEFTIVRSTPGTAWTWMIWTQQDAWVSAFGDLLELTPDGRIYRFRDGNNTPIPGRGSYR